MLFSIPQNGELTLRKFGDSNLLITKNLDFVLETPENEAFEAPKSTKTPILCSKRMKTRVSKPKKAQKHRFCARNDVKLASGSIIAEPLTVNLSFLQITEHASKMQMSNNQIINFYQRAR